MMDEQFKITLNNKNQDRHEHITSIKSRMSKFLARQVNFSIGASQRRRQYLMLFCGTLGNFTVSDPELRSAFEVAITNLQNQF